MARDEINQRGRHAALGPTVARLCEAVAQGDVIAVASGEGRGEAIARAVAALSPALVLWCPPPDTLPGEGAPASPAIAGQRVAALAALHDRDGRHVLLVTDASAAAQKVAPPSAFAAPPLSLRVGDPIDGETLPAELGAIGYFPDDRVDEPGEFAVRAGTIDLFPTDADRPTRIHVNTGRIENISTYDPVTQLGGGENLQVLTLRPAAEPAIGGDAVSLFDHLPAAAVALDPDAFERRDRFVELAQEAADKRAEAVLFRAWDQALARRARHELAPGGEITGARFVEARNPERAFLTAFNQARSEGKRILIAGSARDVRFVSRRIERRVGEAPRLVSDWADVLRAEPGAVLAATVELGRGWIEDGLMVVTAVDILGERAGDTRRPSSADPLGQGITDVQLGDAVIHEDHGLGILRGIEVVATDDLAADAVRLEQAGGAQRLVPVEEADRLWRYGAEAEAVTLDKLDGSSWQKRRAEIDLAIAETARQLIGLAEERARRTAPVLDPAVSEYERFAATFPFNETQDQARAIEAVRADLASGKPMDRLVVGDVGYGKTEVALRAAAAAALCGKQVAVVAPTTVLVRQHLELFRRRFARFGVEVAGLSRLSTPAEVRQTKQGLAKGSIRIVIGTKAVAGRVEFQDLGLIIIDEEQRFGTADKRRLRELSQGAHVLTLTATPIPRTLQGALVGLQDLSLITTPPARRLPTRTSVAAFASELVRPALIREKRRGGQSFVVVPRIEDMAPMAERLVRLVPDLRVRRAHGKMPAAEIDEEMIRFSSGDGDILLATNIIEAGLDIPRANTMLIWRADRFGLAQLHQLRGRIGRGRQRGYLLLLTEEGVEMAPATTKRLRTMEALDQLGAGFAISARDLDLRGAGELLGESQAGHVKLIGLGLYQRLLGQALRAARGEHVDDWTPELHLGLAGRLPEDWIPEEEIRINLYARIARLASTTDLDALGEELEDRFGSLPPEVQDLIALAQVRQLARAASIARIDAGPAAIALTPRPDFAGQPDGFEQKGDRLLLKERFEDPRKRLARLRAVLEELVPD
ncbi:MAG TPA: DEAD/DEAH box helicase [Allosphingosinicella sp.]|jgi:transcription-repair coupling factor (superfamily II helicase)|uniref:DEAD/DEAH box helicase n=1 Tax=Allosphingosinicella sp. TaxID=2823234 RepID=UPI002F281A52